MRIRQNEGAVAAQTIHLVGNTRECSNPENDSCG
jgi:hypothetical protein